MNTSGLVLLTIFLSSCAGELIIADSTNNEHLIVNEDLTLVRKFDLKFSGRLRKVKTRKTENGLTVYDLEQNEIAIYTVSNDGKVSKTGKISIGKNDEIDAFDVQPSGELIVMSSGNKIYLFSPKENKATEVLEIGFKTELIFIHPTERIIYYAKCFEKAGAPLFIYEIATKTQKRIIASSCNFDIDFEKNTIWDNGRTRLSKRNLEQGAVSEGITSIPDDTYTTTALSSDHLFFMRSEKKKEIYKLTTSPKLQKQISLPDYKVEPVLSQIYGKNPVIFNAEKAFIEILDPNFEKVINKIEIKTVAEPIRSLRTISKDKSTTFFWIHESNKGKVEYVKVVNDVIEKRDSFEVPTSGTDLIDFDVNQINKVFYFATERKLLRNYIDISKPIDEFETLDLPFAESMKALEIQQDKGNLIISYCDQSENGLDVFKMFLHFDLQTRITYAPRCSTRMLVDEEDNKANRIIASSTKGLYNLGFDSETEQISSLKSINNLLLDGNHLYFVSKTDGPGIYKLDKRSIQKIDHKLPLKDNGNFVIIKVKESEIDKSKGKTTTTKIPYIPPANPIDETTTTKIPYIPPANPIDETTTTKIPEIQPVNPADNNPSGQPGEKEVTTANNNPGGQPGENEVTTANNNPGGQPGEKEVTTANNDSKINSNMIPIGEMILLLLIQLAAQIAW